MVGRTTFKITAEGSHDSDDDTFVKIASTTAPLAAILANNNGDMLLPHPQHAQ